MSQTPEQRSDLEARAKADIDSSGFKINFASTESIRDWCQSAAHILSTDTDAQKKAQSEYLEAMQNSTATPGQIVAATNKFVTDYTGKTPTADQPSILEKLRSVADGTAAHYNLDVRTGDPATTYTDVKTEVFSKFGLYTPHTPTAVPAALGADASPNGCPVQDKQLDNLPDASKQAFKQMQTKYGCK